MNVSAAHRALLLDVARASIRGHMDGGRAVEPPLGQSPAALREHGASFVTLSVDGRLRGCMGSIVPTRALVTDVWSNAMRTAFDDPRFPPLEAPEVPGATVAISVLGPLESMAVGSEEELLSRLRPGVDGLLLTCEQRRATFLPKVWETIADRERFVRQLKRKMGVAEDFWHPAMRAERYRSEEFAGPLQV